MARKEIKLREQQAPEKNTDRAFVKVAKDGSAEPASGKSMDKAQQEKKSKKQPRS